jgi:hypothetical protein
MTTRKLTVQMYRTEKTETPTSVSYNHRVPNGTLTGDIAINVDLDGIFYRLGERALRNKTHRAKTLGGLIVVVASNLKREGQINAVEKLEK